jgi:hypothetical protein
MVKRILGTLGLGLACSLVIVIGVYMAVGFHLAVLIAIMLGVGVGIATIVQFYDELEQTPDEDELPKVFIGSATVDPNGKVTLDGDMPPELAKMLGFDGPDEESAILKLLDRLVERGEMSGSGKIEPELDCEGKVVGFNVVPEHGLSDRELKEVEEKWGT